MTGFVFVKHGDTDISVECVNCGETIPATDDCYEMPRRELSVFDVRYICLKCAGELAALGMKERGR